MFPLLFARAFARRVPTSFRAVQSTLPLANRSIFTQSPILFAAARVAATKKSSTTKRAASRTTAKPTAKKTTGRSKVVKAKAKPKTKTKSKRALKAKSKAKPKPKKVKKKKAKVVKEWTTPPKKPLSPFVRYSLSLRTGKVSWAENIEHVKYAGTQWHTLSDAEKKPFFDAYTKDRAQYLKDNEAWKTGTSHRGYRQYLKAIRRRREVYGLKDESGNLLKAPPSAYALFTAEKYKEARDRGEVGKIVEIAATWKGLSEASKQVYKTRNAELLVPYLATKERAKERSRQKFNAAHASS